MQQKVSIKNRKARFNYELLDRYTAGIQLGGTEIKSIRAGKASIAESFCEIKEGEIWCINMHIDEYQYGSYYNHRPKRDRKLLLQKKEIKKMARKLVDKGITIVPLEIFINDRGLAKINIALARGKKLYDKREVIKIKDINRDLQRNLRIK
ncbi:MAG: SsrA-binding protein SmpB [Flavobacteriales bacterium]